MANCLWYRTYHGMVSDPKWPLIARRSGHNVGTVVSVWAALLDFASQNEERGSIAGFNSEEIDALYGYDDGTTAQILKAMRDRGMIVDDVIVSWEKRQASKSSGESKGSAMSSTERSRRYRERQRESQAATTVQRVATACNGNETLRNAVQRDATVPLQEATETQRDATAYKIREDKNREENIPPLTPLGGTDAAASDACEQREQHTDADTSAAQAVLSPEQPARKRQTRKDEPPLRPEDWEAWYAMYPRHEARQAGVLAWNAAVRSGVLPDLGVLLDALGWQVTANGWTPDRKQYIPLPATYLNARRWQDERPPAQVFSSQRPAPQRPYSKADEMLYVVEHNRRVAAQVLAEFEAEQNARQEQENGNTNTETGSGTQAFIPAGHGCELRQDF